MKVIIVGCGKLGSGIASALVKKGQKVTVIDSNPEAFDMLGKDFPGEKIVGVEFDKSVLEKAQIRSADALIACSKSDEVNALIGRIARNIYKVPRVISRLYDPKRAEIYRSLGIQTISTTTWGVRQATEMLSYNQLDSILTIGDIEIIRVEVPALLVGRTVKELSAVGEIQVLGIARENKSFIPTMGTAFHKYDVLFISVLTSSMNTLKGILGMEQNRGETK
jgi:trk system potassium uptake protein TrkA